MKNVFKWQCFQNKEKRSGLFFCLAVCAAFVLIFIFNVLTPMMTDDLFYSRTVSEASGIWELFAQEYTQYMTWTGRSVCHMILRFFLLTDKMVFNVANSVVFVLLTLLIYWNVEHKRKYDTPVYLLINLLLWMFGVVFRQTVLWETGACNYLWGSVIIMSFVTLYRYGLKRESTSGQGEGKKQGVGLKHPALWAVFLPVLGVLAGWCNENSSGGGLLMVLLYLGFYLYEQHEKKKKNAGSGRGLKPWMVTGLIGQAVGLAFMVLAPGTVSYTHLGRRMR